MFDVLEEIENDEENEVLHFLCDVVEHHIASHRIERKSSDKK